MNYDLTKSCSNCPFRNDIHFELGSERAEEIADSITRLQKTFSCHKTNDFDDEGAAIETKGSQHCAGAMILLEKINRPNQMMRIAERLGMYNRTMLRMDSPVYDTTEDFIEAQDSV